MEDDSFPYHKVSLSCLKPLKIFVSCLDDLDMVAISSIRIPNVSVRKPKKRGKYYPIVSPYAEVMDDVSLCLNPCIYSLYDKGLPRVLGS